MRKLNLLVAEDQLTVRQGLCTMLRNEPFVHQIFEANNGREVLDLIEVHKHYVDVVLLDILMPVMNGLEAARALRKHYPTIKVVCLTGLDGHELLLNLLKLGVHGIVYKLEGFDEITKAILNVVEKGAHYTEDIMRLIGRYANRWSEIPHVHLNEKEKFMLRALIKGENTKQIAEMLSMSERTAETYRQRLLKKVQVPNTAALIAFAFRNGLI